MAKVTFTNITEDEKVSLPAEKKEEKGIQLPTEEEKKQYGTFANPRPYQDPMESMFEINMEEMEARVMAMKEGTSAKPQQQEFAGINQNMLEYFRRQMEMEQPSAFHGEGLLSCISGRMPKPIQVPTEETLKVTAIGNLPMFEVGGEYDIQLNGETKHVLVKNLVRTVSAEEAVETEVEFIILRG